VLTKVDEAEALGRLITLASRTNIPVSYLTTGQDIPDDIEVASGERLATIVWER
jgi:flagellar biosynthesis protein FlhF